MLRSVERQSRRRFASSRIDVDGEALPCYQSEQSVLRGTGRQLDTFQQIPLSRKARSIDCILIFQFPPIGSWTLDLVSWKYHWPESHSLTPQIIEYSCLPIAHSNTDTLNYSEHTQPLEHVPLAEVKTAIERPFLYHPFHHRSSRCSVTHGQMAWTFHLLCSSEITACPVIERPLFLDPLLRLRLL